jgi:predicted aldo/keto reductase-like oxidoreductase
MYGECADSVTEIIMHAVRQGVPLIDTAYWVTLSRAEQHICQVCAHYRPQTHVHG